MIFRVLLIFLLLSSVPAIAQDPVAGDTVISDNLREAEATIRDVLSLRVVGNTYGQLLACFGIILLTLVLRRLVVSVIFGKLRWLSQQTGGRLNDRLITMVEGPAVGLVLVVGIFTAIKVLTLPDGADLWLERLFFAATMVMVFWGIVRAVDVLGDFIDRQARGSNLHSFVPLLKKTARIFVVILGVVLVIQNLGYSVGSLLAGLGIGGLAVALAAQESLSNFFGSIAVAADQSFKVGDWIQMGDKVDGNVEEIGIRSTKVRTFSKTVMIIPNKLLASEVVENYSRMPKRRVKQVVGVTYETTPDQMEELLQDIRALLKEDEDVHQEFHMVHFTDFGASSLDILVYYFTVSTNWQEHMAVRERMNLKIMGAVKARGLSIAFPTRTLYFEGDLARRMAEG